MRNGEGRTRSKKCLPEQSGPCSQETHDIVSKRNSISEWLTDIVSSAFFFANIVSKRNSISEWLTDIFSSAFFANPVTESVCAFQSCFHPAQKETAAWDAWLPKLHRLRIVQGSCMTRVVKAPSTQSLWVRTPDSGSNRLYHFLLCLKEWIQRLILRVIRNVEVSCAKSLRTLQTPAVWQNALTKLVTIPVSSGY